jgi:signal transduction histidine kinase
MLWHLARLGVTANQIGDQMIEQIEFGTRDEYLLAEQATERGMSAVVQDLNDQLTVISGLAQMGGEVSYDAERTENYFAQIESAGKTAAQITRQLLLFDPARPSEHEHPKKLDWPATQPSEATTDLQPTASSFRRRLTAARARVTTTGVS